MLHNVCARPGHSLGGSWVVTGNASTYLVPTVVESDEIYIARAGRCSDS